MTIEPASASAHERTSVAPARALLATPRIAWPTLGVFVVSTALWGVSLFAIATGRAPLVGCVALSTAAAFMAFTPLHDASHRSLARARWLNEIIGRISALILAGNFPGFRYLHLEHHKFTNEPERDPDFWVSLGKPWLRPLRWMTMEIPYVTAYRRRAHVSNHAERIEIATWLPIIVGAILFGTALGYGKVILFGWLIPAKIAGILLAYAFDYLPHRPHAVSSRVDRFRATVVQSDAWRTPLLLYQNYHLIHHLYPAVPFYRYSRVWRSQRETLLASGAIDLGRRARRNESASPIEFESKTRSDASLAED